MINSFKTVINTDGKAVQRLIIKVPTPPNNDLLEKMADNQMEGFKTKLNNLLIKLNEALNEADPVEAATILQKEFGSDFRIPTKESTGTKQKMAVTTESSSANKK